MSGIFGTGTTDSPSTKRKPITRREALIGLAATVGGIILVENTVFAIRNAYQTEEIAGNILRKDPQYQKLSGIETETIDKTSKTFDKYQAEQKQNQTELEHVRDAKKEIVEGVYNKLSGGKSYGGTLAKDGALTSAGVTGIVIGINYLRRRLKVQE